ncbi:MAG: TAT-variant-translocated molybdopterin oxidoreductase [Thermoanaerobaculia bacterium]
MSDDRRADKAYWRSLERLYDSPALAGLAEEFASGASEPPDGVSRRTMLQIMGASMAFAGLAACRRPESYIVPYVDAPPEVTPGIPRHYATTWALGLAAYGLVVESHEERPTKIEGNRLHPATRGAANAWMQASLLELYDPDRTREPQRRGEVGEAFPATWRVFVDFWQERAAALTENGGRGLALLVEPHASPTLARLTAELRRRFPEARVVAWSPVNEESAIRGCQRLFGRAAQPLYHLDRAQTVLALDCDLLGTEPEALRHTREWAVARRPQARRFPRLYAVESTYTLTGANADHRLPLKSALAGPFLAAVAAELLRRGVAVPGAVGSAQALPDAVRRRAALIAESLAAAGSGALVAVGGGQPPEVHALAAALHAGLGSWGTAVTLHEPVDAALPSTPDLAALTRAMAGGEISDLVVLGGNPAHSAPADLRFAAAMGEVPHVVHLGSRLDETARRAEWHLPETHFLEAWGDARAADGTASVVQPLIAPLYGGRSTVELLALLATGEERSGADLVRETWTSLIGDDVTAWRRVLHDGVLAASAPAPVEASVDPAAAGEAFSRCAARRAGDGYELTFQPSRSLYDGRFANNSWLQELPDPVTKLTWGNAALMSEATAGELGVENGDVVRLELAGSSVELPAWILPGQADGSIAVELGYGRQAAGRVGDGVGADVYPLRPSTDPGFVSGVRVTRTGEKHDLAQTQEHHELVGRDLIREASVETFREDPHFATHHDGHIEPKPLYPDDHDYSSSPQWGMTIDLNACTGCNACVVACQAENNIPVVGPEQVRHNREMHWLRVDRYFSGSKEAPAMVFQPVPCMHCETAPCEEVCPVAATVHDAQGLNVMVYNRCIGTRYCSNNCPYKVRRFNFFNYTKDTPEVVRLAMNPDVTVRSRGVMEKCTYCLQRIREGEATAARAGRPLADGDVQTACQQTCAAGAIRFGDIRDQRSQVAEAKRDPRNYSLLAELDTRPRTTYLAGLRNPDPAWEEELA